jgi:hypothetical protein
MTLLPNFPLPCMVPAPGCDHFKTKYEMCYDLNVSPKVPVLELNLFSNEIVLGGWGLMGGIWVTGAPLS